MIGNVKDLSKVILNPQDVLVKATLIKKKETKIILTGLSDEDKADFEEWSAVIIATGKDVDVFNVGDIVVEFKSNQLQSRSLGKEEDADRISVIHMNNIEIAATPDNYEQKSQD